MDGWAVGSGARVPIAVPLPYAASVGAVVNRRAWIRRRPRIPPHATLHE